MLFSGRMRRIDLMWVEKKQIIIGFSLRYNRTKIRYFSSPYLFPFSSSALPLHFPIFFLLFSFSSHSLFYCVVLLDEWRWQYRCQQPRHVPQCLCGAGRGRPGCQHSAAVSQHPQPGGNIRRRGIWRGSSCQSSSRVYSSPFLRLIMRPFSKNFKFFDTFFMFF